VARHRSIDELYHRRSILFCEIEPFSDGDESSYLATLADPGRQPEELVELHKLRQEIFEAVEILPPNFRAVVSSYAKGLVVGMGENTQDARLPLYEAVIHVWFPFLTF
jgi:DNA-directed RNA polymerase specialized sigma24 family protein